MKAAFLAILFLALSIPAFAADNKPALKDHTKTNIAEMRLLLNSFVAISDEHIESVLRGLRLIAGTDEAQSGEWGKIGPLLAEFARSGIKAAAVWFATPDGSYYSVEKGLTGLNLRDRPYFPGLMAGNEVTGDLVLSKSTGARSIIIAYPVKKNGKVTGVLGVSLSAREISQMIELKMALPENIVFYALNRNGQTVLHSKSALIFAYPSDMGSKSLAKTVKTMLSRNEGEMTYDFYGQRTVVFKKSPFAGWVYAIAFITGKPGQPIKELPPILEDLKKGITNELDKMDRDVANLAGKLSGKCLKSPETKKLLTGLCRTYSFAVDCSAIDCNGKMITVEPKAYAKFEGKDISAQEQIARLQKSKKPVLSDIFKTVEGVEAADLEYPVFSNGHLDGSVSLLFRPESLLAQVIDPVLQGLPVESFVMQTDGRILFDQDKSEVGRNLFTDPSYKPFPQLIALGSLISKEKTGSGSYDFWQKGFKKEVKKDAHWTTVGLHETQWRLVAMHVRAGSAVSSHKNIESTEASDNALRILAKNAELTDAMPGNNISKIEKIFGNFYQEHEGLYSGQWLDAHGVNRCGYPEEDSLVDSDLKKLKTPSAKHMLSNKQLRV